MYKTVRHGDNSLQYKILAQQEEGVTNIKYRNSPRTVTAKLVTLIVLLITGIIASAVLVPLILTNDFIALTGTFQKFSVSTLRRSHSGNHVVVIAKKPYGWNVPHSSVPPRLSSASNSSQGHLNNMKKLTVEIESPPMMTEPKTVSQPTKTSHEIEVTPSRRIANKGTESPKTEASAGKEVREWGAATSSSMGTLGEERRFQTEQAPEREKFSSTPGPVWFEPIKKWRLPPSENFINGVNGVVTNPVSIVGSFLFVSIIIIIFFILRKTFLKRTSTEEDSRELKEDKTRLLKPSVSSDHDEE